MHGRNFLQQTLTEKHVGGGAMQRAPHEPAHDARRGSVFGQKAGDREGFGEEVVHEVHDSHAAPGSELGDPGREERIGRHHVKLTACGQTECPHEPRGILDIGP